MLGKLFPYVLIALGDVLLVMTVGVLLFHVPLRGSPLLVILASLIFLFTALGIGLYISVISRTQQAAMTLASLTTQLPTVFLSGFVFPISSMPFLLQLISHVVPATHLIRILRAIFLKGGGFSLVWPDMLVMLVFALIVVGGSALKFKKKL